MNAYYLSILNIFLMQLITNGETKKGKIADDKNNSLRR